LNPDLADDDPGINMSKTRVRSCSTSGYEPEFIIHELLQHADLMHAMFFLQLRSSDHALLSSELPASSSREKIKRCSTPAAAAATPAEI
jgi:hypothetical protein